MPNANKGRSDKRQTTEWFEDPAAKYSPISQFDGGIPEVKLVQPLSLSWPRPSAMATMPGTSLWTL